MKFHKIMRFDGVSSAFKYCENEIDNSHYTVSQIRMHYLRFEKSFIIVTDCFHNPVNCAVGTISDIYHFSLKVFRLKINRHINGTINDTLSLKAKHFISNTWEIIIYGSKHKKVL